MCCLQETHLKPRDTYRLKLRGWKKIFHANGEQKKAEVAKLLSDKIDFGNKGCEKRQSRTLHNYQIINPIRRYNNYKKYIKKNNYEYMCTQHRSTTLCKANTNKNERGN